MPQSNQRGIETPEAQAKRTAVDRLNRTSVGLKPGGGRIPAMAERAGLNRTSVGLKHKNRRRGRAGGGAPQSNQRGIETA